MGRMAITRYKISKKAYRRWSGYLETGQLEVAGAEHVDSTWTAKSRSLRQTFVVWVGFSALYVVLDSPGLDSSVQKEQDD